MPFVIAVASVIAYQISQNEAFGYTPLVITALSLMVIVLLPWVGLGMMTLLTARYTSDEDFALLRMSRLSEAELYQGLLEGNLGRVGGIRTTGLWLVVASLPGVALIIGAALMHADCSQGGCPTEFLLYAWYGALPASIVLGGTALVYWFIWKLSINGGIWIAIRATRTAITIASAIAVIGVAASVVVYLGVIIILFGSYFDEAPLIRLTSLGLIFIAPISYGAARLARRDSLRTLAKPYSTPTLS